MFVALSKFTVANGPDMQRAVKEAFRNRPHQVDEADGFVRLDVLNPRDQPDQIWLLTYWINEASFQRWYGTHRYQDAHQGIPPGLRLGRPPAEIVFLEHISS